MDELVNLTTLVDFHNAIFETFENWDCKENLKGNGEKVFAYDDMYIIHEVSHTWSCLCELVAFFWNDEVKVSN